MALQRRRMDQVADLPRAFFGICCSCCLYCCLGVDHEIRRWSRRTMCSFSESSFANITTMPASVSASRNMWSTCEEVISRQPVEKVHVIFSYYCKLELFLLIFDGFLFVHVDSVEWPISLFILRRLSTAKSISYILMNFYTFTFLHSISNDTLRWKLENFEEISSAKFSTFNLN